MKIQCTTEASLHRPEARRWRERMHNLKPHGDVVVILPCSMRKPYSLSKSHRIFMRATKGFQEVILTSPFGICPREMENTYPIQSYDVSTTGDWSKEEIDLTGQCLQDYVDKKKVIAHVSHGYRKVCEDYVEDAIYTCHNGITTSSESLKNLKNELRKFRPLKSRNRNLYKLRSIASYQFNTEEANDLIPDGSVIKGRFNRRIIYNDQQIATLQFKTGLFSLNLKGGELLKNINRNWVEIDFELKTNTLFAPGVQDSYSEIIPKDEVVILKNDQVVGVGKAVLNGVEMKKADRGPAVRVRHRL